MKKIFNHILLPLLLLGVQGCKKKNDPPIETQESVFSFTGKMNGSQVTLASGISNYFMYSDTQTDANNTELFIGEMKQKNCSGNCGGSLKLILKDYRSESSLATPIDSSLRSKFYNYSTPAGTANSYSVTFIPQFLGGTPLNYNWTFHNGTSTQMNPSKIYTEPGKYSVCLSVQSTGSCSSSLCNNIKIGQLGNIIESGFAVSSPTGNVLNFTAQPVLGSPPYSYDWGFGDGNNSTLANPSHTYAANGIYLVTLTVTDAKGQSSSYNNNVNTQSPGSCMTRISFVKSPIANTTNFANVTIEWTDAAGTVYTSSDNSQSPGSGFEIKSVEEYLTNDKGQKTKKIKAAFNCTLYSGANTILVEEAELVFALAYP
jgi:PKD repeat protein